MPICECQIWPGFRATGSEDFRRDRTFVRDSARVGGPYAITYEAQINLEGHHVNDEVRAKLTTMILDQLEQGVRWPLVDTQLIEQARKKPPIPVDQRADRLLRFVSREAAKISTIVTIQRDSYGAYAWSESVDWDEIDYLLDFLKEMGWIKDQFSIQGGFWGRLTVSGYHRIAEYKTNLESSQAFVAMWFDDSMDEPFDNGVRLAITDAGYNPLRIDQKPDIDKIDDEIISEIRRSRFLVADFTHGKDGARGGVYFEAGFAHGLGIPVIYSCRSDMVDKLHFDTRQYAHIVWETPEDLRSELKNRIIARIGEGPGLQPPSSPTRNPSPEELRQKD